MQLDSKEIRPDKIDDFWVLSAEIHFLFESIQILFEDHPDFLLMNVYEFIKYMFDKILALVDGEAEFSNVW